MVSNEILHKFIKVKMNGSKNGFVFNLFTLMIFNKYPVE